MSASPRWLFVLATTGLICCTSRPAPAPGDGASQPQPVDCRNVVTQEGSSGALAFGSTIKLAQVFTARAKATVRQVGVRVANNGSKLYPFWVGLAAVKAGKPDAVLGEELGTPTVPGTGQYILDFWRHGITLQPGAQFAVQLRSDAPSSGISPHWSSSGSSSSSDLAPILRHYQGSWAPAGMAGQALFVTVEACSTR